MTREKLAEIVDSGDGWDVLHLSGHGGRGQFWLEQADGSPDPVDTGELMGLLGPLRRRVRLAVVSACESAAATTAETLRWVGLEEQAGQLEEQETAGLAGDQGGAAGLVLTGVARALVERLECAVVAMRYPVTDEFAIAFTEDLYDRVLGRGQRLGTALARAVPGAAGPEPSPARPAICLATPVLAGAQAAGLVLPAPAGAPLLDPAAERMYRFPPEPERFVGRAPSPLFAAPVVVAVLRVSFLCAPWLVKRAIRHVKIRHPIGPIKALHHTVVVDPDFVDPEIRRRRVRHDGSMPAAPHPRIWRRPARDSRIAPGVTAGMKTACVAGIP